MSNPDIESGLRRPSADGVSEYFGGGCSTGQTSWSKVDSVLHKANSVVQFIQVGCLIAIVVMMGHGFSIFNEWYYS